MAQTLPTPGANQTLGFGNGKSVLFTYTENFDCVDQPTEDLNFNSILAQSDPAEMYIPICQPGNASQKRARVILKCMSRDVSNCISAHGTVSVTGFSC